MAAALTFTPAKPSEGDAVTIDGTGFLANTVVTVSIVEIGDSFEVTSDAGGEINSDDLADKASATLTLTGNAVAAETVTIGAVTYTWRAAPTTTANEVKVGATASDSLDNLKAAINLDAAGSGTLYGSSTVVHPTVSATNKSATTLLLAAKTGGTGGNSLASTETMTNGSFGGATFTGGAASTGVSPLLWTPSQPGTYTIKATDGTNTATVACQVWSR